MADMQFPNVLLGPGTFSAAVIDNNGSPSSVLEAAAPFTIQCSWTISPLAALLLGGQWQLAAYVESMGPGPEQEVGAAVTIPLTGATNYSANIVVPANTLPNNPAPPISGTYKLVTLLTHRNFGNVTDVAAVVEGPIVRIA
ncbi:MAG TPA: hypothetical protein VGL39_04520 [Jatrophihabitantaceae bacterium]|jgi:hypothetical protein